MIWPSRSFLIGGILGGSRFTLVGAPNTTNGYFGEDVDLNGLVIYTGSDNDRDPVLQNIGGNIPTNERLEQLP